MSQDVQVVYARCDQTIKKFLTAYTIAIFTKNNGFKFFIENSIFKYKIDFNDEFATKGRFIIADKVDF
ncbi:hypothetical protein T07_3813 [Trichinella nelsoni]|uniref:Uncharacterized protein n=1 Tax=Trichinella nelsoni TaxID=6336 RepID=A0A0V0SLJ6_9BILA|nr:hypothetical protein T07_3813 [Trichinella nelsoni]